MTWFCALCEIGPVYTSGPDLPFGWGWHQGFMREEPLPFCARCHVGAQVFDW